MALATRCLDCGARCASSRCLACARRLEHSSPYNTSRKRSRARATIKAQPWCSICGSTRDLTADHIIAVADGGIDGPLRTLCRSCNSRLGAQLGNARRQH